MTTQEKDRILSAIGHINTAVDVDEWATEIAVNAMEKQIPQKTGIPELGISKHYPIIIPCGNCGAELTDRMWSYCPWCGQAVRWSE